MRKMPPCSFWKFLILEIGLLEERKRCEGDAQEAHFLGEENFQTAQCRKHFIVHATFPPLSFLYRLRHLSLFPRHLSFMNTHSNDAFFSFHTSTHGGGNLNEKAPVKVTFHLCFSRTPFLLPFLSTDLGRGKVLRIPKGFFFCNPVLTPPLAFFPEK